MSFFRRGWFRRTEPRALPDPVDILRDVGTDRGRALADEIERGRARQATPRSDMHPPSRHESPAPNPDDPYWRAQDAALLRAMRGCKFGAGITLPSGRFITGEEAAIWQELETDD